MDIDTYRELYGEIDEASFKRYSLYAQMLLEKYTTTLDGVCKIREFPPDEQTQQRITLALGQLIDLKNQIEAVSSAGAEATKSGSGAIASISSGSESISFHNSTEISYTAKAAADKSVQSQLESEIIQNCLFGLKDSNGVNLLYRGIYPRRYL